MTNDLVRKVARAIEKAYGDSSYTEARAAIAVVLKDQREWLQAHHYTVEVINNYSRENGVSLD